MERVKLIIKAFILQFVRELKMLLCLNLLWYQTLVQYFTDSGRTGTFSCLWGLYSSSLPTPDHFHMGWKHPASSASHRKWWLINEREKENERERGGRKSQMRKKWFGRVLGKMINWVGKKREGVSWKLKTWLQSEEKEGCRCGWDAPQSSSILNLLPNIRPQPAALLPEQTLRSSLSSSIPLSFFLPLSSIFIAGTPPGLHTQAWKSLCLHLYGSACMFCFSFTGFIILPQLGKNWLWPFRVEQFLVGWFTAKKGKLQKICQF